MKKYLFIGLIVLSGACMNFNDAGQPVEIRLHNTSTYLFENIKINTVDFGFLEAGEYSTYHKFEKAYRYSYVQLTVDTSIFTLQPIDYVGEEPLKKGRYTYELGLDSIDNTVILSQRLTTE